MQIRAQDVAAFLGGSVVGDPDTLLSGIAGLNEAKSGDLSFLANPKYGPLLTTTLASAVLVAEPREGVRPAQIVVANPDLAFAKLVTAFGPKPIPPALGIHPSAVIGDGVTLYPQVVVGAQASIGTDSVLYPHASIRERCRLGARVILQPGAVIGSDGFGYALQDGKHTKIPQVGIVVIEDDVEVGANTAIDRARFGKTRIGAGTKIDNLVQIAHNVETGSHCIIVAQVGIAGSTRLGNYVTLGGQAGITGHITIGDQASVTAQSGVSKSVPPKAVVRGSPAQEFKAFQAQEVHLRRLGTTQTTVKALEQRVADLEALVKKLTEKAG